MRRLIVHMDVDRLIDRVKKDELSFLQHRPTLAISAQRVGVMADHQQRPRRAAVVQSVFASLTEAIIARSRDLVDQIAVEIDGKRDTKRKTRHHAGGIAVDRLMKICTKLGKVFDIREKLLNILAVNPRNEARIVRSGQAGLEAARIPNRPGTGYGPLDHARSRCFNAGDETHQRRFTRAVRPAYPQAAPCWNREVQIIQDVLAELPDMIAFRNVFERNHWVNHIT